jgi:tripartite-type tricarboxylate transporter receptor subunit TctC
MAHRCFLYTLSVTAALFAFSAPCASQSFPTRPLRMIVSFAPGGVADIVARIVGRSVQSPEIRTRFASLGVEGVGSASDEFRSYIKAELARWEKTIREARIKAD